MARAILLAQLLVSRANPNNPDKVVVQTPAGSYTVIDPEQECPCR